MSLSLPPTALPRPCILTTALGYLHRIPGFQSWILVFKGRSSWCWRRPRFRLVAGKANTYH
ncbi:hypothetical protein I79_017099 [Cricetulus griseus]|uniref:Uncharacterized protein n=1 Tax=Cricetulus griseus TaxID=10029 RepID=G3I153_CRIGR|nr:hypothetical protein I79_017099 [Cricetulus griseus]